MATGPSHDSTNITVTTDKSQVANTNCNTQKRSIHIKAVLYVATKVYCKEYYHIVYEKAYESVI